MLNKKCTKYKTEKLLDDFNNCQKGKFGKNS